MATELPQHDYSQGISAITLPDNRWGRCDIKTVQLLYPSLAKMEAKSKGGDDAWLVRDGLVAGDRVIVEGLQKVAPGVQVDPILIDGS